MRNAKVILKDVRISFPELFVKRRFDPDNTATKAVYSAVFMVEKESDQHKQIVNAINALLKENNKGKGLPEDKLALKDGDMTDREEYHDHMIIRANNANKITVVDRSRKPITEEDGVIYSGCYVNGIIELYWQDHPKWGKRINASLLGVQYVKDGDPFGGSPSAKIDDFVDFGDEEEEEFDVLS